VTNATKARGNGIKLQNSFAVNNERKVRFEEMYSRLQSLTERHVFLPDAPLLRARAHESESARHALPAPSRANRFQACRPADPVIFFSLNFPISFLY
jgi:hypothetical protein